MQRLTLAIIALCMALNVYAQKELSDTQFEGFVIDNDGKKMEGIIEMNPAYPWDVQKGIKFIPMKTWETKDKIKNKDKEKYDPKDLQSFQAGDMVYETQKYADLSAVGFANIPKKYFLKRLEDGKIKLYRFYSSPPKVISGRTFEEVYAELRENYQLAFFKEGDKIRSADGTDMSKYIDDCEMVWQKFKDGLYGNAKRKEEMTKVGKFLRTMGDNMNEDEYRVLISEYNQCEFN